MNNDIRAIKTQLSATTSTEKNAVEREKRAIYTQIELNSHSLNDLEYAISALEDQLSTLVSPEPDGENLSENREIFGNSPMYYGLSEEQIRIDAVTSRLRRLCRTLEV